MRSLEDAAVLQSYS